MFNPKTAIKILFMAAALAVFGVACSTNYLTAPTQQDAASYPGPHGRAGTHGSIPHPGSGELEEIVVTGSRRMADEPKSPHEERLDRKAERERLEEELRQREASLQYAKRAAMVDAGRIMPEYLGETSRDPFVRMMPGEEVWVIATTDKPAAQHGDDVPGSGAMLASLPQDGETKEIPLPLQHTAVNASIDGYIGSVNVTQTFANPFASKIEAVYLFPLPEKAAVSEFVMVIGERRIRGILREKEEAKEIYEQARAQGYQASLLSQLRPNIFQQKVANIEPGKSIDIDITYFHTLAYEDGWYSWVFPTVVGPRFNPPGSSDPIGAVPAANTVANDSAVRYLAPEERSAHDISIAVSLNAGVAIEELESTHAIDAVRTTEATATVTLADIATIPNRDFVLRFRVAGETMKSGLLSWIDPESQQGYFTMMMYPPADTEQLDRQAMELVFVLDTSGSMSGRPLNQAKAAVAAALDQLRPDDTFQIIRFSDRASSFGSNPVPASASNIRKAKNYLQRLDGGGGTHMIEGIQAALNFPHDEERLRFVSFMTDGYIGNEAEILAAIHEYIGDARIFSFGVGSSVNGYLMERMASAGRGAVAYLRPQDSGAAVMSAFFDRISHPAMTDLEISWGSMAVSDVYPSKLPDLFVGRPLIVTGKFLGAADDVTVSGSRVGMPLSVAVQAETGNAARSSLSRIWARLKIAELVDEQVKEGQSFYEYGEEILQTALEYELLSDYTSFVAVDTSRVTEGSYGTTVHQAVPVPDGVRYDTTVERN